MGKRLEQVNALIERELGAIFLREIDLPRGTVVTIKRVTTASDCESATVWISVLPAAKRAGVMTLLGKRLGHFQARLQKRLIMHFVPKISLRLDESEERADRVLHLLDTLKDTP